MKEKKIITGDKQTKSPVNDEILEQLLEQQRNTGNDKAVEEYLKSK